MDGEPTAVFQQEEISPTPFSAPPPAATRSYPPSLLPWVCQVLLTLVWCQNSIWEVLPWCQRWALLPWADANGTGSWNEATHGSQYANIGVPSETSFLSHDGTHFSQLRRAGEPPLSSSVSPVLLHQETMVLWLCVFLQHDKDDPLSFPINKNSFEGQKWGFKKWNFHLCCEMWKWNCQLFQLKKEKEFLYE